MADSIEQRIIEIIQNTLRKSGADPDIVITAEDSMETIAAWDSLTFMSIFLAINESFSLDPDFDDAIHYTSVKALYKYLKDEVA
jgi:acyl carrier protein